MTRRHCCGVLAIVCLVVCPGAASADYILKPLVNSQPSLNVLRGDSFVLDLVLSSTSTPADSHWAAIFTVDFSKPGLRYLGHSWYSPYNTTSSDNRSTPGNSQCPLLLSQASYVAGSSDPGTVDVYFENFLGSGEFGVSKLVSSFCCGKDFWPLVG